ncbi:MAG: hypothetical protein HY290_20590, partial [Planctomycetia bacterium]|nr:hypothetical protein [Planctomycetia bacterium]
VQDQILKTQLKSENADQAAVSLDERAQLLEKQAALVAQKIAETRKNIDLTNRRQAAAKNEYALVAYDGTSGTQRRPIYIECTGKGFRFLPENETLSPTDLDGFSDGFNPLLAGAQTLVRFWARRRRSGGPAEPEPYVLLVVRPSGCFTYYLARKFLSSLGVHWGYELIEEDWKLNVPDADPVAKSMLRETLDATVKIHRPPQRAVSIGERDFGGPFDPRDLDDDDWPLRRGAGDSRGGSGFGKTGQAGSGRKPGVSQGYATRNDRGAGDRFPGDRPLGSPGVGEGPDRERTGFSNGLKSPAGKGGGGGGNGKSNSRSSTSDVAPGPPAGDRVAGVDVRQGGSATGGAAGSGRRSGGTALAANSSDGGGPGGSAATGGSTPKSEAGGGGAGRGGRGSAPKARPATLAGNSDSDAGGDGGEGDTPLPTGFVGDDASFDHPPSLPGGRGTGGEGASDNVSRDRAGKIPLTSNPSPARGVSDMIPEASGADPARSIPGAEGAGGPSSPSSLLADPPDENSTATGATPRDRMGGPGVGISLGSPKKKSVLKSEDDDDGPRISENDGRQFDGPRVRSQAPRKWGQAGRRAGTGFEKKVKIYLNDKKIFVDARQNMVTVNPTDSGEEIVNHVASLIDHVADGWGEPPSSFYWVPVVDFVVYPGGHANYARLQKALEQKWGVTSTVRYASEEKDRGKGSEKDKAKKPASGGKK